MDLPDCPPGAEGYHDSVTEVPKKLSMGEGCTKAEKEFQEHLNSLKIKLEDGETRCMVERRGRDISGKWIYLCYPCAAMCSGESILQTHISGKKHKTKLTMRTIWPKSIFEEHPYVQSEKGSSANKGGGATEKILQKMAEEVDLHNKNPSELDVKYSKYRSVRCHIEDSFDTIKAPLIGLEYLIEHPPEQAHYEPCYMCTLCSKQGHPRTITNHMTCFWHRYNYLVRHFPKACSLLTPYRAQPKYREGVGLIMNRLAQRIEDKFGRMRPVNIDKEEYEKDKERIHQWIFKGYHFSENDGQTLEEVVDVDLITSLHKSNEESKMKTASKNKDPSPPIVAAPSKPHFNNFTRFAGRQERRAGSMDSLSDISDDQSPRQQHGRQDRVFRSRHDYQKPRFGPYQEKRRESPVRTMRYTNKNSKTEKLKNNEKDTKKAPNYDYKVKLADEKRIAAEESAKKTLAYHEKNPEKHPLYPEEWKKFWNRRYKEIQLEGKDASKHDFKPEWIVFWTARMKELHDEELRVNIHEIYRKLCLTPPDMKRASPEPKLEPRRRSPEPRRRSPEPRRRSPEPRRRSPEVRRSPDMRRRSPGLRRRSPDRRRSPESRRLSPAYGRDRRSPDHRRSPGKHRSPEKRHSSSRPLRTRSRSPLARARSPARTHITLESVRRSRSPLSRRDEASRNRSPQPAPSLQTVMISDDELKPDGLSPWDSDNDLDSLGSLPDAKSPVRGRSRSSMVSSRASRARSTRDHTTRWSEAQDLGPAENVVATLRLLVALEDYLGSLGPKIIDLLTEALKMEKEQPNSSEELLVRESAVVLIETAKEKLKGAVQAGLVPHAAAAAVRSAVVRAAATLHEADTRSKRKQTQNSSKPTVVSSMPVAGVGEVDRAQIAQQMAAALIAQGKTDVSSEELAQLVDAVVGMAEAKKRESEVKKKVEARATAEKASRPQPPPPPQLPQPSAKAASTASALQMLQSAYDETDTKKVEKEDAPDAMDGLSDSDLETLLKNFNELSAEEQHSLIAYLKKLEAREPQRVERLRQYVSAAASTAPGPEVTPQENPQEKEDVRPVTIESDDDDDYTVEEVFKSVTQKVKEDQIRQEMEIVKKSLEESKSPPKPETPEPVPIVDLTKNMSSATDLLALVQASIQSTSSANTAPSNQTVDVVTSSNQPRSFGDRPEATPNVDNNIEPKKSLLQTPQMNPIPTLQSQSSYGNQGGFRPALNPTNNSQMNNQMDSQMNNPINSQMNNPLNSQTNNPLNSQMNKPLNSQMNKPLNSLMNKPLNSLMNNPMNSLMNNPMNSRMNNPMNSQMNNPMNSQMNNPMNNRMNNPMSSQINNPMNNQMNDPMDDPMNNQMNVPMNNQMNVPMNNQMNTPMNNQMNTPMSNQMNYGGNRNFQNEPYNNQSPWDRPMNMNNMSDNRGPLLDAPPMRGLMEDQYNQGPRGNFMNGRMQDNFDSRQPNVQQQFGNYDQGNNFRGRGGRGNYGGPMRGRGRGGYY